MAIARDTATQMTKGSGGISSVTFSHTCTGSNLTLLVGFQLVGTVTGVTYNGVSMSLLSDQLDASGIHIYLYGLVGPATGANNVVITRNVTTDTIYYQSVSYTGVSQIGLPDSTNKGTNSLTSLTVSTTTVADKAVVIGLGSSAGAAVVAGAGITFYSAAGAGASNFNMGESSTFPITPAGSYSMTVTGTTSMALCLVSLAPVGAVAASQPQFLLQMI